MEGAFTILAENGTVKIGGQYLNTIEYQQIKNTHFASH
jgi:UDP-N-acetyl-2-amino-2-deoxyglucuronate dehydrogenase